MTYTEQQRTQMIKDAEDEISIIQNGTTCCQKHVKRYCRNKTLYLNWMISRLQRKLSIENSPSTMYCPKLVN